MAVAFHRCACTLRTRRIACARYHRHGRTCGCGDHELTKNQWAVSSDDGWGCTRVPDTGRRRFEPENDNVDDPQKCQRNRQCCGK